LLFATFPFALPTTFLSELPFTLSPFGLPFEFIIAASCLIPTSEDRFISFLGHPGSAQII
jgi:hypothetical protein